MAEQHSVTQPLYICFNLLFLRVYLMKVIPETHRVQCIRYLRFYFYFFYKIYLQKAKPLKHGYGYGV